MIISRKDYEAALRRAKAEGRIEERKAVEREMALENMSRSMQDEMTRIYRDMGEIKDNIYRVEKAVKINNDKAVCSCNGNG